MTCLLHIYRLGASFENGDHDVATSADILVSPAPATSLRTATADDLNALVTQSSARHVGFIDARQTLGEPDVNQLVETLRSAPDAAAGLLVFPEESPQWSPYSLFRPRLACLVAAPERYGLLVVNRRTFETRGPFRNVSAPLWDWVIRMMAAGEPLSTTLAAGSRDRRIAAEFSLPELAPSRPAPTRSWLSAHIQKTSAAELLPRVASESDAKALKAGLFQIHDELDESHRLSQSVEGQGRRRAADYWHAIMHRREPDYSNSKYWFGRVRQHPIFGPLGTSVGAILDEYESDAAAQWAMKLGVPDNWNPSAFVDLCRECERMQDSTLTEAAQRIQWAEMLLLLQATFSDAGGSDEDG